MNLSKLFFWRPKVDVQDVFNQVIDAGYYRHWRVGEFEHLPINFSEFMCVSLTLAEEDGVISRRQFRCAVVELRRYLKGHSALASKLCDNKLPRDFESRLAIYRDWANRPSLK